MKTTISRLLLLLLYIMTVVGCVPTDITPPAPAEAVEVPWATVCESIIKFSGTEAYTRYGAKPENIVGWTFHINFRDGNNVWGCFRIYVRDDRRHEFVLLQDNIPVPCSVNSENGNTVDFPSTDFASFKNGTITCPLNIQELLQMSNITTAVNNLIGQGSISITGGADITQSITNYVMSNTHTYDNLTIVTAAAELDVKNFEKMTLVNYLTHTLSISRTEVNNSRDATFDSTYCLQSTNDSPAEEANNHFFDPGPLVYWWYDFRTDLHDDGASVRSLQLAGHQLAPNVYASCIIEDDRRGAIAPVSLDVSATAIVTIGPLSGKVYEVLIDPIDAKPPANITQ